MSAWDNLRVRSVLLAAGLFAGFIAFAPPADAQQVEIAIVDSCLTVADPGRLGAHSADLLPRDGSGFFNGEMASLAVRAADDRQEQYRDMAQQVATSLDTFFTNRGIPVSLNTADSATRTVLIDGDVAVPGQPVVYAVGGTKILYLHWTTAEQDLSALLADVASFEALTSSPPNTDSSDQCTQVTRNTGELPEPSEVLAYVNEQGDDASGQVGVPLADSSPKGGWPYPVSAAAILVASGGVLVHRREKYFGDSDDGKPVGPGEADPASSNAANASNEDPERNEQEANVPEPDNAVSKRRVVFLEDADGPPGTKATSTPAGPQREIDLQAKKAESPLTRSVERAGSKAIGRVLPRDEFARLVSTEWSRHTRGGRNGAVASIALSELEAVRLRLGNNAAAALFDEVSDAIADLVRPLDVLGFAGANELALLMPETSEMEAREVLDGITKKITATSFSSGPERVLLTPATGYALLSDTPTAPDLVRAVESARALSMLNLDLDPERWDGETQLAHAGPVSAPSRRSWAAFRSKLRTPLQIALTVVIAWVIPFFAYFGLDAIGFDISYAVYLGLVVSLVLTGAFIMAEGFMAVKQKEPPEVPSKPYPKATALIAAYMPNEAATIIETIEAFLALDYPNDVQILLAYNTPDPLPVEEHLDRIAAEHPNFVPVRVVGSKSKAQNVNAVLSMAEGEFIGMFDADHQPRPDAFTRAWRWIDAGYDVVQGHCLTRNGDSCFLAKMIAVEFESIYGVAHPGRAKMHRFGVFGGSNGFWRTELLHETRMRGSMLTEDIDSSMRVIGRGFKIRSDRDLVSRELATTTFTQIWNQRMRWAQGWFQVSMEHVKLSFKSKDLSIRQKLGLFHLLMWRELYPWLSQQLFPLLAFWATRQGGLDELNWTIPIFLATSIFTFSVGPAQTYFAYKLADPEIKQHKSWFWAYLLFTTPFYTEYKNLIARVAHVKQLMGESDWRVTPRS